METETYLSANGGEDTQTFFLAFALCLACHVVVFLALVFLPGLSPARKINLSTINVRMVSLPADLPSSGPPPAPEPPPEVIPEPPPEPPTPEPEPVVEVPPEPPPPKKITPKVVKPEVVPKPEPDAISLAPKKPSKPVKKQGSLKKKTYDKAKVQKIKQKDKAKREQQQKARQKADALARIKKNAAKSPQRPLSGSGSGSSAGGGGVDPASLKLIELYSLEAMSIVSQNWAFSQQLGQLGKELRAVVIIKVGRNGKIMDVWFETRSGNAYLDESAYRAVKKSDPLPPLPQSFARPYVEIGLNFTPRGIS